MALSASFLIKSTIPLDMTVSRGRLRMTTAGTKTYLWHDGLAVLALHVAEGHLRALVLVELEVWVVDIWNLVKLNCGGRED